MRVTTFDPGISKLPVASRISGNGLVRPFDVPVVPRKAARLTMLNGSTLAMPGPEGGGADAAGFVSAVRLHQRGGHRGRLHHREVTRLARWVSYFFVRTDSRPVRMADVTEDRCSSETRTRSTTMTRSGSLTTRRSETRVDDCEPSAVRFDDGFRVSAILNPFWCEYSVCL